MNVLFLTLALMLFSSHSYAKKCEGINACSDLYTELTGERFIIDNSIDDEMSLGAPDADLNAINARVEFLNFINKNVVSIVQKNRLVAARNGEFLTAPIYIVSDGNIPRMINKDGLVTLVYHSKKATSKLVSSKTRALLTRKKNNTERRIIDYSKTKIIAVSDTFENAERIMILIMKSDK